MSANLVGRLVREAEQQPEKVEARSFRKSLHTEMVEVIETETKSILGRNLPIVRAQQVQLAIEEKNGLEVSLPLIRKVLRKEMRLGYRIAKDIPV